MEPLRFLFLGVGEGQDPGFTRGGYGLMVDVDCFMGSEQCMLFSMERQSLDLFKERMYGLRRSV